MSGWSDTIRGFFDYKNYTIFSAKGSSKTNEKGSLAKDSVSKNCVQCNQELNNCFRSQVDHDKEINQDIWSVSILILAKGNKIADLFSHHTILIIEGFNQSGKFWRKAHLMGPGTFNGLEVLQDCFSGHSNVGQVQLTEEKYYSFSLKIFKKNRQTWTTSREKIELMLKQIKWEQQHPESTPFRFLGEKSIASMTREFLDTRDPELVEIENENPENFRKICGLINNKDFIENFLKWHFRNMNIGVKISTIYAITFTATVPAVAIASGLVLASPWSSDFKKFILYNQTVIRRAINCWLIAVTSMHVDVFLKAKKYKTMEKEFKEYNEQLGFIETRAKKVTAVSQNCFNWARKHLVTIDVELPEKSLEKFIAIPEFYLPNEEKDAEHK